MQTTPMSGIIASDVEAVTALPVQDTWCNRLGVSTKLRDASWQYSQELCVHSSRPCSNHHLCHRVAIALNRPGH